jgi:hypothetical protein
MPVRILLAVAMNVPVWLIGGGLALFTLPPAFVDTGIVTWRICHELAWRAAVRRVSEIVGAANTP